MIRNYIFLGAPGVGKGTLAKVIAERNDFIHISTGDMFRDHIKRATKIGLKVKEILSSGAYVPDELTNELVKASLLEDLKTKSVILDGYPRTINQAKFLLEEIKFDLTSTILLDADDEIIQARLENRARVENRQDDTPEVIHRRIETYHDKTKPLIDFYNQLNKLLVLDLRGTIEENYKIFQKEVLND